MTRSELPFTSVAEAQRRARSRLPRDVYSALVAGKESGVTSEDNVAAFREIRMNPKVAECPRDVDLSTSVMGFDVSLPVVIAPTGVQAVHPDGEVAMARAARKFDTAMGLSSFASRPVDDVGAETDALMFQVYWIGSRDQIAERVDRARAAGARGLIITLDWVFDSRRDWGVFSVPERMGLRTAVRYAPQVLARPRYLASWARAGQIPELTVPNLGPVGGPSPTFSATYESWRETPAPTWDDVAWLRELWDGPFMVKGVTRVDDALRCVDVGASALSVSNHGGNNLDGTPAAIRCLPPISDAVRNQLEVLVDGGIRRGSDVAMALALGAHAVMVGRAPLWGLAVAGEQGVTRVLEILRDGIAESLFGLGRRSPADIERRDVLVPPDFAVRTSR